MIKELKSSLRKLKTYSSQFQEDLSSIKKKMHIMNDSNTPERKANIQPPINNDFTTNIQSLKKPTTQQSLKEKKSSTNMDQIEELQKMLNSIKKDHPYHISMNLMD